MVVALATILLYYCSNTVVLLLYTNTIGYLSFTIGCLSFTIGYLSLTIGYTDSLDFTIFLDAVS